MTITDTPRARLEACLKAAKTVQTVESISKATGLGEGTVVNLLNAMRTENNVEGRKVNKGTVAKPKYATEYWWTGKGIEPPSAGRPPMTPRAKKPEKKKVARSLTHDIVSVMQDHQPGTEFRSDAIASLLAIKFPDETVSRQIVAQRLSTMTAEEKETLFRNEPIFIHIWIVSSSTTVMSEILRPLSLITSFVDKVTFITCSS